MGLIKKKHSTREAYTSIKDNLENLAHQWITIIVKMFKKNPQTPILQLPYFPWNLADFVLFSRLNSDLKV